MWPDEYAAVNAAAYKWWRELQAETGTARARSARLRRCATPLDALLAAETYDLLDALRGAGFDASSEEGCRRVAVLAMALAHARFTNASNIRFASALGRTTSGKPPGPDERQRQSPARFGALMRAAHARDWDGFVRALRRASAILCDAPFDIRAFAGDILFLSDAALQRWTYDYWQTPAPTEFSSGSSSTIHTEATP